ncbi:MAG: metalloregulator ArsR/SmtB family transcription factor [Deltaproteobacteria bacterium]|jgi:DNA-binding transcriptional ArsR family regulator|nr:metalloregulator ArsR/SmtB family transcription factor [Deltaproteobacteria bacterium]
MMLFPDDSLLKEKAKIIKAAGHPTRLYMIQKLATGERCVCKFVNEINSDFSTISRHLGVLKEAGIVSRDKRGKQVFYKLAAPCILGFLSCVEGIIEKEARARLKSLDKKKK